MQAVKEFYQDQLLYIFTKRQLKNTDKDYLIVLKKDTPIQEREDALTFYYEDDFEKYLKHPLPKLRKVRKLLSLNQCFEIIGRRPFGTCAFMDETYPYIFPINHVVYDNRLFFHTGLTGHKLEGINKKIAYNIVDDLGINVNAGTHNHQSVSIFGTLKLINEDDLKREVLLKLVRDLAPPHPYNDGMLKTTNILELEIDYIIGKRHFY